MFVCLSNVAFGFAIMATPQIFPLPRRVEQSPESIAKDRIG
jgi:hypothetical protein